MKNHPPLTRPPEGMHCWPRRRPRFSGAERRALFLIAGATLLALAAIATATLIALDRLTATQAGCAGSLSESLSLSQNPPSHPSPLSHSSHP
jgi:hypothetical protein